MKLRFDPSLPFLLCQAGLGSFTNVSYLLHENKKEICEDVKRSSNDVFN